MMDNRRKTKQSRLLLLIRIVFHFFAFILKCFVLLYGCTIVFNNWNNDVDLLRQVAVFSFGYGTNWNYMFQTCFLGLSLIYDVLTWLNKTEMNIANRVQYYRDVLFNGLVVPMTCFISSMFWTVFLIDRELVFPVVYDQIIPWWFNHCVHTNITIVIIIETILQARRHPRDFKVEIIMNATVGVAYAVVYYSIYFFGKRWLYAVFGIMTWWQVCLYQLLIWGSCFLFYFIQFPINRIFHREPQEIEEEKTPQEEIGVELPTDSKGSPFMAKSWSLKYRSIRNQIENSRL